MNRAKNERVFWEAQASNYDHQVKKFSCAYEKTTNNIKTHLNGTESILEIACGTGIISLALASHCKHIHAVDISPAMISTAEKKAHQQRITNISFQTADAYQLPYESGAFDCIILCNTLHVVASPETVLAEAARLLKTDGILYTATDCYGEKTTLPTRILLSLQKLIKVFGFIKYLNYYTKTELMNIFHRSVFQPVCEETLHSTPVNYYVALKKKQGV